MKNSAGEPASAIGRHLICMLALFTVMSGVLIAQDKASSPAQNDTVYELKDVKAPKPISTPEPEYSDTARRKKISGNVLVRMVVQPDGTVRDVKVIKSLEKSLDQQAISGVSKWKFEPATKDGKPVAVHLDAEVTFRIR